MQEEQSRNGQEGSHVDNAAADGKREQSSIQFPYGDLEDAIEIAKAIHEVGGHSCEVEQLAGYLRVAASGGGFRARLAYPRIFGLAEYERGTMRLTPLGMRILDASKEASARIEAFLTVPLYKAIYEQYKSYTLPPPAALEREMAKLGVSTKQTDKARQAFDRSAKQAGFYWAGPDRLTMPVSKTRPDTRPIDPPPPSREIRERNGGDGGSGGGQHPLIQGLISTLPTQGEQWDVSERIKWLQMAASIFAILYKSEPNENGVVAISLKKSDGH